ncbi:hypothetical protein J5N97_012361 [Dioscorea zingiberensis]|uniref:Uncharacterized protein n=1 Tax=Dioscorea zingiberensis TaxID=325984 RepID=A0A9D5CQX4_9LILI|nr:hypothetical protein J5N97_012361 [Dioscorea zingiberensis]
MPCDDELHFSGCLTWPSTDVGFHLEASSFPKRKSKTDNTRLYPGSYNSQFQVPLAIHHMIGWGGKVLRDDEDPLTTLLPQDDHGIKQLDATKINSVFFYSTLHPPMQMHI